MIFAHTTKPKGVEGPTKLRHILADQVKPKVFNFDRNRFAETHPKRKPGGPLLTSQLGDIAAMKKRAEVAAIPDVAPKKAAASAQVAEVVKKRGGRQRKAK